MSLYSCQAPAAVVMIRPRRFYPNPETAIDNIFQRTTNLHDPAEMAAIADAAYNEVTQAADALERAGVRTHMFDDDGERGTPDSVFPGNWFSTHKGGRIVLYPMKSMNRRRERRPDVVEMLKSEYRVREIFDYTGFEYDRVYLEGTGAIVLDHVARIAYTARSRRADPIALQRFCAHFNFEPVTFSTLHRSGCPIYHTNVMMSIATEFSLVCLELIEGDRTRRKLGERMEEGGREVVTLDADQIAQFAGAALELTGSDGLVLAMSERGVACLTAQQRSVIERSARILALRVPTIEMAGGSVSCMLGGIHLTRR